jgi:hypothetical protein
MPAFLPAMLQREDRSNQHRGFGCRNEITLVLRRKWVFGINPDSNDIVSKHP